MVMQRVSQDVTYASTGGAFFGWLLQQDWLLITSALCSVAGLVCTVYFKYKEDRRKQAEFELRLAREYGIKSKRTTRLCTDANEASGGKYAEPDED